MRTVLLVACLGSILLVPCSSAGVNVQTDPEADYSAYSTYAWHKGLPAARKQIQGFIVDAVESELEAKGLTKAASEGEADLYVVTYAFGSIEAGAVGGFFRDPSWSWGIITVDARAVGVGTLVIELVDVQNNRLVFHGVADNTIIGQDAGWPQIEKKVKKVTKKILGRYPNR